jgi:DNA-binding LacI/PurR family transcriptional regulator
MTTPDVTGVFCHPRTIGNRAASLLIGVLEGDDPAQRAITIPAELNVRRSTLRNRTN